MRKLIVIVLLLFAASAYGKETDPRVLDAMISRDAAKASVLEAMVSLARARAALAAEAAKLAEVKAEVARAKIGKRVTP